MHISRGPSAAASVEQPRRDQRFVEIDILRGFALIGISLVNTVQITNMPGPRTQHDQGVGYWLYETLLHQRFFPIFSLLFGVSFGIFLQKARSRTQYPRLTMVTRLGFLILFGALDRTLQPDEVLLPYGVVGIAALLPASFFPMWPVLAAGTGLTVGAAVLHGGVLLIPGAFLLGLGLQKSGLEIVLGLSSSLAVSLLAACSVVAVGLNFLQVSTSISSDGALAAFGGLATASAYVLGVIVLLRTRARRALYALAPTGRMALTSYVGAAVLIHAADYLTKLNASANYWLAFAVGFGVFLVEFSFSWMWLKHAVYGPLEWVWRCLTWWSVIPNSRRSRAVFPRLDREPNGIDT
ncbi:DUF418 domain-containing protein [Actinomadura violacea]|uniref:DUF418 domain-containing protein n=1 Tax=Actinomadura violacea TaxID=2819934 RepID=A0ABS3RSI3_9ACTN|nr:DUF418 domain-containing protein [Actinomadura violacea]MBO2459248.1 DUF418 domain-containing protein [Actinomadura violacea]